MRPERHNTVKVLLFLDVGGSMDWHVKATEELFSAAKSEFKHLVHLYFHNCLYEKVWKQNARRWTETTPTWDVLHTYPHDYKVIFVGDATMSPYEIVAPGGSVEHFNEEAGRVWMERIVATYPACVWLNPVPQAEWATSASIRLLRQVLAGRMYPLTIEGLDAAMRDWDRKFSHHLAARQSSSITGVSHCRPSASISPMLRVKNWPRCSIGLTDRSARSLCSRIALPAARTTRRRG